MSIFRLKRIFSCIFIFFKFLSINQIIQTLGDTYKPFFDHFRSTSVIFDQSWQKQLKIRIFQQKWIFLDFFTFLQFQWMSEIIGDRQQPFRPFSVHYGPILCQKLAKNYFSVVNDFLLESFLQIFFLKLSNSCNLRNFLIVYIQNVF